MSEWSRKLEEIRNWTDENISQPLTIDRSPGWSGRMAHGAVQTVKGAGAGLAEAGRIVGGALDEHVAEPMQRELYEGEAAYRKLNEAPTHQVSKDFGKDYLQKNISNMFGEDGSLKIKEGLAGNYIAAEQEAEAEKTKAQGKVDKAATDTSQPTGPVNDPNVKAVAEKVAAVTAGKNPDEVSKAVDEAKTASEANIDEGDLYAKAIDKTSQDMHNSNITPDNWYESDAFRLGLIRFGLGLMSGEDYATAFSSAAGDYTVLSDRQKRESYTDELLADGYRQADIMEWISKGDASVLKLPEKKATYKQITKGDGSIWQVESGTNKMSKLQDATKPVSQDVTYQTFNGQVHAMDKRGNIVRTLGEAGTGSGSGSGKGGKKGPTEAESKARFGGSRAKAAVNVWNDLYYNKGEYPLATRTGTFYTGMADESQIKNAYGVTFGADERSAANQERIFLAGVLRPESGAAVSNSEWNNYGGIFFDRHNDSPRMKNQKAWLRDMTVVALDKAGNDFTEENQEAEAKRIIDFMSMNAGRVVEYRPESGAVKLSDGKWYSADFNLR